LKHIAPAKEIFTKCNFTFVSMSILLSGQAPQILVLELNQLTANQKFEIGVLLFSQKGASVIDRPLLRALG